jgi:hypothetical protein
VTIDGLRARFLENAVVKESTSAAFRQTTDRLREHFGGAASIATLGAAQAKSLREEITVLELKYFGPHGASDLRAQNRGSTRHQHQRRLPQQNAISTKGGCRSNTPSAPKAAAAAKRHQHQRRLPQQPPL